MQTKDFPARRCRLQWDRAFDSAEGGSGARATGRTGDCFNGTAHLIARKALASVGPGLSVTLLQWDRAFDSAEGNCTRTAAAGSAVLQWDRAFDSAEGWLVRKRVRWLLRFNGTAHLIARKVPRTFPRAMSKPTLQWDRAFDSAEGPLLAR